MRGARSSSVQSVVTAGPVEEMKERNFRPFSFGIGKITEKRRCRERERREREKREREPITGWRRVKGISMDFATVFRSVVDE
jgi:hypothetical protein